MKFRSQASLRLAASLAALLVFSACSDNRSAPLSAVQTIDIPAADPGAQANQNINNPVLTIPQTFPVGDGDQLTLVWSEEFDGPDIDPSVWFFATGDGTEKGLPGGWGNNELQYYLPDNAMIVNGVLEITARRETVGNLNYTSARINTEDRFAFKYGRIEARMKLPSGQGLWPAFWMLSQDSDYVCGVDNQGNDRPCVWAATGEIDIVEAINLDGTNGNEIFATIHYGGEFPSNQSTSVTYTPSVDVTESFNTYAIEWDEDKIRWYFNGLLYAVQDSWNSAALNGGPSAPFDQNFHILLNLAVGGNFPGSPNGTTPFPATMQVDWVRVYSGEDPSGSAATEPNVSAPTPTEDPAGVISLFSDAYTDIAGIDYNPNWNQATVVTQAQIAGNKMLKYAGLNYQGMDFAGNPQDVSDKGYLHLDFWTADSTALNVYLISPGSETPYALPVTPNSWVSVDVLLTEFAGVDLTNVIQLKFDGNGTIFLDNLYFGGEAPPPVTATGGTVPGATILEADGSTADLTSTFTGFSSGTGTAIVADSSYSNALEVTVADGYAPGVLNLAQLFITGLSSLDSYDEFLFKVKGLTDNNLLLKIEPPAGTTVAIDLTAPGAGITVEDLGDGWFQVVVSLAPFGDLSGANQVILQTLDNAYALGDTFLLTDIGFNSAGATGGTVPDATILEADGSTADLTSTFTGFSSGTGTAIVADSSYSNALEVTVADGYAPGVLNLAQLFITGLSSLDSYDEFLFKVKGLTDNNLLLKIEPPAGTTVAIDLTAPGAGITVEDLGDGWFQVVVSLAPFGDLSGANQVILQTLDNAYALGDTFLLTDIGFNTAGGGTATGGTVPDATILEADGSTADLTSTFTGFSSGTGTAIVADSSYSNALEVTVADGYAPGVLNLAQLFITGLSSLDSYDEFLFKVKGLTDNNLLLKIEPPAGTTVAIDLTAPGAGITVEDLGDGWFQVVVSLAPFGDLSGANQVILQTLDNAYALGDTFLLTDIGFNTAGGGTATGGTVPDATILEADGSTADLTSTFTGFSSGTGTAIVADSSYSNALEVTVADGYAPGVLNLAQLFITGLSSLDSYDEFLFKVKGLTDNNLLLKIEPPAGTTVAIDLTAPGAGITVEDLGDGWFQVVVSLAPFGDLSGANQVILQTLDNAYALGDTFLLTDIGFNTAGGGTATGGTVPDATILEADGSTADLTSTFTGFSSGTGTAIVADSSYSNALEVTVADGYAPGVLNLAQLFITGLSSLDSYDEFLFKVKGLTDNNLLLKIEPPAGTTVAIDLTAPGAGITVEDLGDGWFQVVVSLAPFGDLSGANQVILQTLDNAYALGDTFLLTDIGFNTAGGGGGGEIAVNGGFENGDLSNWALFPANASDPNEQTVVTTNPKTGTYAGRINNTTPASASIIKQANLTPVSIGQTATITFSARGSFGVGGVAFAEFFTEISGGGTSSSQILGGGPLTLDADPNVWSDFSFVIPITTDVSGGVTLQLTGTTGGDAASFADVYYDDISIVITD